MDPRLSKSGHLCIVDADTLHEVVVTERLLNAQRNVWIATADLKDMHIRNGKHFVPILSVFNAMAERGVAFRIIHAKLPSRSFRKTLERHPRLTSGGLELQICSRSHWKMVIVDECFAYLGSANFTGAGIGARSSRKRNFELGVASSDADFVAQLMSRFDTFWMGSFCADCALRDRCPDPIA